MKSLLAAIPLAFLLAAPAASKPAITASSQVVYYGMGAEEALGRFDVAFVECRNHAPAALAALKAGGTRVLCYLSIGEDRELREGDRRGPGGKASWYFDRDADFRPDRNPAWNTWYVNAGNAAWQKRILDDEIPALLALGGDGLLLDGLDTVDLYRASAEGMITLVRAIAERHPDVTLVANRGLRILDRIGPYLSGLLFENFTSDWRADLGTYAVFDGDDLDWIDREADRVDRIAARDGLKVFTLDFAEPSQGAIVSRALGRARIRGYVPCVSTLTLDRILLPAPDAGAVASQ